ncbi:MAG: glucosylglycerol 3-phosphatase [Cyanobacteria bacterium J06639_1]
MASSRANAPTERDRPFFAASPRICMSALHPLLQEPPRSLNTAKLAQVFATTENLLIVQDLDGVCMGLVKDPLTRQISPQYVEAIRAFEGHFFVLTNGEHIGKRGVNAIVDRAFADPSAVRERGWYLPGLGAGGVQWQDRWGSVDYPGVSEAERAFLATVPDRLRRSLAEFVAARPGSLDETTAERCIESSVLDNAVSPTANLNTFYEVWRDRSELFAELQQYVLELTRSLEREAAEKGLSDSFFVHLAPNLGRDETGREIVRWATEKDSGTTDFQFMLQGAIKEAGVVAILNRYYFHRTGKYPLGETFNARQAPKTHRALLDLVTENFAAEAMPTIVGVGDTVNSSVIETNGIREVRRGGSDRNFLQLIQDLEPAFNRGNIVAYVDSSGGELANRKPVKTGTDINGYAIAIEGPGDPLDADEPLAIDVAFAGGHEEYCTCICQAAGDRLAAPISSRTS